MVPQLGDGLCRHSPDLETDGGEAVPSRPTAPRKPGGTPATKSEDERQRVALPIDIGGGKPTRAQLPIDRLHLLDGFPLGMEPELVRVLRPEPNLGGVQEADERRQAAASLPQDDRGCH